MLDYLLRYMSGCRYLFPQAAWDLGDVVLSRGASEGDQIVMSSPGNVLAGPGIIEDAELALVLTRTTHDPK